jgi:branched-subunit amino acid permease
MKISGANSQYQRAKLMKTTDAVVKKHHLARGAARVSIVMLTLGFSLLGLLSLTINQQGHAGNGISTCGALAIIGGATSCLLGGIFFVAGCLHWNRFPSHS